MKVIPETRRPHYIWYLCFHKPWYSGQSSAAGTNAFQIRLRWSYVEVIATKNLRSSSQSDWRYEISNISNDNGYFTFYTFLSSITANTLTGLNYMSITACVLEEAGTAYPSRALEFPPSVFGGVRFAHLFRFLYCPIMFLYVELSSAVLWCPLRCPHTSGVLDMFVFTSSCL
jgi:hypothetical protein